MTNKLRLLCIAFSLVIIILILLLIKKDKINIRYSLIWLILFSVFLILTIFPSLMIKITGLVGFQTSSNMVFAIIIGILIIINIMLTVIVSSLKKKIKNIVQEISINNSKK